MVHPLVETVCMGILEEQGKLAAGTNNVSVSDLATMLGLMNTITFTLSFISTTDTNSYRIAGPWIKMLLENSTLIDTSTAGKYVKLIANSFTLQVQGYDVINTLEYTYYFCKVCVGGFNCYV